ncbi:hypothetical protein PCASD_09774 [Puccinia coronata f. sp. avenae]|uniref:Uncharacterized protein n=1 Tax=Puccinia coronata f. sp. avenae TaxID=200324 RepID=A0A2N5U6D9_9BASI|nr:hypothetical protein PCASD_14602 [Puccinia coronata f. sp. avenae]PLW33286.1 hypothetical protein PCASD_09774 [Puccinia coronata f. sp. avenae]
MAVTRSRSKFESDSGSSINNNTEQPILNPLPESNHIPDSASLCSLSDLCSDLTSLSDNGVDPRLDSSTLESSTTIIQGENSPESRKEFMIQLNSQAIGRVRKLRSQNTPDQSKSRGANFEAQNLNSKAVLTSVRNFIPKSFKPNIIKNIPRKHCSDVPVYQLS